MIPTPFLEQWFDALGRASWQAALMVPIVFLLQWALRRQLSPAWQHGLWWIVVARRSWA